MPTATKIVDTLRFELRFELYSYGNGWAYKLVNGEESLFFQDDDATAFRDDWEALETAYPDKPTDHIMAELWAMYYTC